MDDQIEVLKNQFQLSSILQADHCPKQKREIHNELNNVEKACVSYTNVQGDFKLNVSEWYHIKNNLIEEIIANYHIGEFREDRKLRIKMTKN